MSKTNSNLFGKLLLSLLALLAIISIGTYLWTKAYIRSDEFSIILQHQVSKKLGGATVVGESQWDGWKLDTKKVSTLSGKGFKNLEAERISVELNPKALLKRLWSIDDVHIRQLSLHLGTSPTITPPPAEKFPITFDWTDAGKALLPRQVEVNSIWVEHTNGTFGSSQQHGSWTNGEIKLSKDSSDYRYSIPRGQITLNHFPELHWEIDKIKGRINEHSFFINEANIQGPEKCILTMTGEGTFHEHSTLEGELEDLSLEHLIQPDWQKRVQGLLSANFIVTSLPNRPFEISGHGNIKNGALVTLPMLEKVAKSTGIQRFRHIEFDHAEFDYSHSRDQTTLRNINLTSNRLLKITGELTQTGSSAQGDLRVGLSEEVISRFPKQVLTVFSHKEDLHHWADVKISRTQGSWENDLTPRLLSAFVGSFLEETNIDPENLLDSVKNLILGQPSSKPGSNTPSDKAEPNQLLEKGAELLENGVQSLFDLLGQ